MYRVLRVLRGAIAVPHRRAWVSRVHRTVVGHIRHSSSAANEDVEKTQIAPGLYVVATPIGNLEDISRRARRILLAAHTVYCEDTRTTRKLFSHFGAEGNMPYLVSFTQRTSPQQAEGIIASCQKNRRAVALVSDAGTPCISDPGGLLVAKAHEAGFPVYGVSGPCALATALSISGFRAERFVFEGFIPVKRAKRKRVLTEALGRPDHLLVFYESPHRIVATIEECVTILGANREAVIAREMTKLYEEVRRSTLGQHLQRLKATENTIRGEFTVVIDRGAISREVEDEEETVEE